MSQFHNYKTFQVILDLYHVLIHFFIFVCLFVSKVMSVGPPTKMSCDNSGGLYSELVFRKLLFFLLAAFCSNINGQKWRSSVCLLLESWKPVTHGALADPRQAKAHAAASEHLESRCGSVLLICVLLILLVGPAGQTGGNSESSARMLWGNEGFVFDVL